MDATAPDRLYRDPGLVQFYDLENDSGADQAFCARLAKTVSSVLDLGCGTGRFAAGIARPGLIVHGVDPAGPMLDVARQRPGGNEVVWSEADARTVRLGLRFELIVMTGHAFQCFLTPDDRIAVLRTIAAHLEPGGRFVLDSRNPIAEEWREWTPDLSLRTVGHPALGTVTAWNDVTIDAATGIVTYETHYRADDGRLFSAASRIAFPDPAELAGEIAVAGLAVDEWLGGWDGQPFTPDSREMIPLGRLAV